MAQHEKDEERLKRETPSQAEGERDTVNAELNPNATDKPDQDLFRKTPSQAEGDRETVNEMLEDDNQ